MKHVPLTRTAAPAAVLRPSALHSRLPVVRWLLLLCFAVCAAHADPGAPAFGQTPGIPLIINGTNYTWDLAMEEGPGENGITLHTDTYKDAAENVLTVKGRLTGNHGNAAFVTGAASGILMNGTFCANGVIPHTQGGSYNTGVTAYWWSSGSSSYSIDGATWQLGLVSSSDTYTTSGASFTTNADAVGNGTIYGSETGVVFNGNLYFNHSAANGGGVNMWNTYHLFRATYGFSGIIYSTYPKNVNGVHGSHGKTRKTER